MADIVREYSNGEITVVWQAENVFMQVVVSESFRRYSTHLKGHGSTWKAVIRNELLSR